MEYKYCIFRNTHVDDILRTSSNWCLSPVSSSTTLTFSGFLRLLLLNPYLCILPFMSYFITTLAESPIFSTVESPVLFSNDTLWWHVSLFFICSSASASECIEQSELSSDHQKASTSALTLSTLFTLCFCAAFRASSL